MLRKAVILVGVIMMLLFIGSIVPTENADENEGNVEVL